MTDLMHCHVSSVYQLSMPAPHSLLDCDLRIDSYAAHLTQARPNNDKHLSSYNNRPTSSLKIAMNKLISFRILYTWRAHSS